MVPCPSYCSNGVTYFLRYVFHPEHTVVSLPYYPIHLKEKNHIKAHSKVKSRPSEVQKCASMLKTLPSCFTNLGRCITSYFYFWQIIVAKL